MSDRLVIACLIVKKTKNKSLSSTCNLKRPGSYGRPHALWPCSPSSLDVGTLATQGGNGVDERVGVGVGSTKTPSVMEVGGRVSKSRSLQ